MINVKCIFKNSSHKTLSRKYHFDSEDDLKAFILGYNSINTRAKLRRIYFEVFPRERFETDDTQHNIFAPVKLDSFEIDYEDKQHNIKNVSLPFLPITVSSSDIMNIIKNVSNYKAFIKAFRKKWI